MTDEPTCAHCASFTPWTRPSGERIGDLSGFGRCKFMASWELPSAFSRCEQHFSVVRFERREQMTEWRREHDAARMIE